MEFTTPGGNTWAMPIYYGTTPETEQEGAKNELRRKLKLTTYILPNDATVKVVFDE